MVIAPYRYHETWVFDDASKDLVREPFVAGVPEMIDKLTAEVPHADKGFRLIFSAAPFPGAQVQLDWVREETGGHWYRSNLTDGEGWLCPALFKYFDEAPPKIFAKAEPIS